MTDEDLLAARRRFAARIPGFRPPVAYGAARIDDGRLTFGHVNGPSSEHRFPAIVLASCCGYTNRTGTFAMSAEAFARAVDALAPAEAAAHWQHPNLWSWRGLLALAGPTSTFVACFVADLADLDAPPTDDRDAAFRSLLAPAREPGSGGRAGSRHR